MSSLAAAGVDNFYYPPEWTPNQGSLNKFQGRTTCSKGESKNARPGHSNNKVRDVFQYMVDECNSSMIAKGVRFNAEKKQVGNYYSTKIWSFTMKSACCKHEIVIQTDPKNSEYVIISGAQRKSREDAETFALPLDEERGNKLADPLYRLKHHQEVDDLQKKKEAEPVLVLLQRVSDARHSADDYVINKVLRARLRYQKKRVAEEEGASMKMGHAIRLLATSEEEDDAVAARIKFSSKFDKTEKEKRAMINAASNLFWVFRFSDVHQETIGARV